ncbi:MAG: protein-L-isoaspartate O-methyltransferase [Candidatus Sericytochromatia bacterium]|nr:protein-L-isoaspartate O-methyltransferase [Candidatus Sericytochromatia bacterium]
MDFDMKRQQMPGQLRLAGIVDERVLKAIRTVPRERFVPASRRHLTYAPLPVALGFGQALMPIGLSALMMQALALSADDRVLEIGTGSGYDAALLSLLAASVVSTERLEPLRTGAAARLQELGRTNVSLEAAGPLLGWPAGGPYTAILVTVAAPAVPATLLAQLAPGGRMLIPIGGRSQQQLVLVRADEEGRRTERVAGCSFVPLVGEGGWPEAPMQEAPRPWF